jgi:hypothetical protein
MFSQSRSDAEPGRANYPHLPLAAHAASPREKNLPRSGQTMLFALMVLVIATFVVLWMFDVHKTLFVKARSRNAGDAAALAAARWQGATLNLLGELNLLQAVSLAQSLAMGDPTFADAQAIADLQARVALTGPMIGLLASQQAAKQNGAFNEDDYTAALLTHASDVRDSYNERYVAPYVNDPSPPTAWDDYAGMLDTVAGFGIAALPDNPHLYTDYADYDHLLLNPSFYDAVASRDWCWFFFHAYGTLQSYDSWRDWPALPIVVLPNPADAEYFRLGVRRVSRLAQLTAPEAGFDAPTGDELIAALEEQAGRSFDTNLLNVSATWYAIREEIWSDWESLLPEEFAFRGDIKAEYNYAGADAAVRLESDADRLTPGLQKEVITWSAAAKPFGALEGPQRPDTFGLVLPVFREVRLIPMDASSAPAAGSRPGWWQHIQNHIQPYASGGPDELEAGCWYCQQLAVWEDDDIRQEGLDWLEENSASCAQPGGPGSSGGGRLGH